MNIAAKEKFSYVNSFDSFGTNSCNWLFGKMYVYRIGSLELLSDTYLVLMVILHMCNFDGKLFQNVLLYVVCIVFFFKLNFKRI